MLDSHFALVGGACAFVGDSVYAVETWRGRAHPNLVSWSLWGAAPLIAFGGELAEGVQLQSALTFAAGFVPLVVVVIGLIKRTSVWKISRLDIVCGFLAALALVGWLVTRVGNVAIIFALLSDGLAAIPTLLKSYTDPDTESSWAYVGTGIGAVITLFTIQFWSFAQTAFPIYLVVVNLMLSTLILRPRAKGLPGQSSARSGL